MKKKEKTNFTCDTKTGICSSNESILQNENNFDKRIDIQKPQLIYYYDALCGWCYGFNSVITELQKIYKHKIDFELISGGLFLGNRTGYINDIAPYIKEGAYKNVEATTGVKFGEGFLTELFGEGKIVLNSLLPAIALCIVKEKFPKRQLEFGELLLKAIYFEGLNPDNLSGVIDYAFKFGFDKNEFEMKMKDDVYKRMAEKEFNIFQSSGFTGMPALTIENKGKQIVLSNGYTNFDVLRLKLEDLLNQ